MNPGVVEEVKIEFLLKKAFRVFVSLVEVRYRPLRNGVGCEGVVNGDSQTVLAEEGQLRRIQANLQKGNGEYVNFHRYGFTLKHFN